MCARAASVQSPVTVESGCLARLVKRADGTVEFEVWDAARWEPAAGRVSVRAFIDRLPASPELLAHLGIPDRTIRRSTP